MTERQALGRLAAVLVLSGGLLSHALDEAGLLPGVRESERVREFAERGAARPLLYLGGVAVAALAGAVVTRRAVTPRALLALVVAGQATLFASFEVVARLAAGLDVAESFVEPAFVTGVLVQVLIAAAFVTVLLLAGRSLAALLAVPRASWQPAAPSYVTSTAARAGSRRPESRPPGRAPPAGVVPRPAHP